MAVGGSGEVANWARANPPTSRSSIIPGAEFRQVASASFRIMFMANPPDRKISGARRPQAQTCGHPRVVVKWVVPPKWQRKMAS